MTAVRPLPWMKFAPDRWQRDEALRMCGAAARGVWMELLCIMHRAEPYGHLLVRGKQPSDKQLSVIAGVPVLELSAAIDELEANEVFSRADDGTIISRGMVRDYETHVRNSDNGHKGVEAKRRKLNGEKTGSRGGSSPPSSPPSGLESELREREESPSVIPPKLGGPKTELPDDWEPVPFGTDTAAHRIESSWTAERRQSELDSFRSNHRRKKSRYSDWQDTWGGWVRNAEKFDNRDARDRPGATQANGPRSHADVILERKRIEKPQPQAMPEKKRAGVN